MNAIDYEIGSAGPEDDGEPDQRVLGDMEQIRPLPRISIHAFCETDAVSRVMDRMAEDRRMSKVSLRINGGGIAAAARMFSQIPTPNLIIVETLSLIHI